MRDCKYNPPTCGSKGFHFVYEKDHYKDGRLEKGRPRLVTRKELKSLPLGTYMYKVPSEDGSKEARENAEHAAVQAAWFNPPARLPGHFFRRSKFDKLDGAALLEAMVSDPKAALKVLRQLPSKQEFYLPLFEQSGKCTATGTFFDPWGFNK